MISEAAKIKRSHLAKILVNSGASRSKVKKLIGYPEISSMRIVAEAEGAEFNVKTRNATGSIRDITPTLNNEVAGSEINLDPSEESEELLIELNQSGSSWSSGAFVVEAKYGDGSNVRKNVFPNNSGDGSGQTTPISLTTKIPTPVGWPRF